MEKSFYAVIYHYDNGSSYDDAYEYEYAEIICPTEELAREYILSLDVKTDDDNDIPWEETNINNSIIIRAFKRPRYNFDDSETEMYWYTIQNINSYGMETETENPFHNGYRVTISNSHRKVVAYFKTFDETLETIKGIESYGGTYKYKIAKIQDDFDKPEDVINKLCK